MTCRFKLVRVVGGFPQYIDYIGSFNSIPQGWSFAVRYVHRRVA
jgi:hypothetical protein